MDPLGSVKPWKDTTYFLMRACVERGHTVGYADPGWLSLRHDEPYSRIQWLDVRDDHDVPFTVLADETVPLSRADAVWLRTDPPFDRGYLYTTLLLDFLPPTTRVINRPQGVRDWNEKLAALAFPRYTPRTLVSNSVEEILAFADRIGRITVKPVDGHGGKGIVFFSPGEDPSPLEAATRAGQHWVVSQEYLPAAREGDKRILLLQGDPLGSILRVHAEGVELNNLDQGGSAQPVDLTPRDREICAELKPALVSRGIFFAGIDVIGGQLIEVNVTSPTGLQEMSRFAGESLHHRIISALE
ncbi:MAG: glutathione synthase [Gammaproteobacteria bacterium]|nr:glutathione synthase [Gammaproteobacteria bacterium]MYG65356.1 glutathione synthase [Gammaproteobacteria bacterium]MYH90860.1 glutathione synthase [Gammaproteobacteria bacterium]